MKRTLEEIEKRFKECTELTDIDLSKTPIKKTDFKEQKQKTIKELSDRFGFVPTPIFLVDAMIYMKYKDINETTTTCDLCAGCGQYTIRLLRMLNNIKHIDPIQFLEKNHTITELQLRNCSALVYIFGPNINLYCGDSLNLKYSNEADEGILFFDEKEKIWKKNEIIDQLLEKNIVKNNIKILNSIFEYSSDNNILNKLLTEYA